MRPSPATTSKIQKYAWAASEGTSRGFIGLRDIWMKSSRVEAISKWTAPRALCVSFGFINFELLPEAHRVILHGRSPHGPLTELLMRSAATGKWTQSTNASFESTKKRFTTEPFIRYFGTLIRSSGRR